MSLSIVGARVSGVVLLDKRCVDKTYPEYFEHLHRHLGLALDPGVAALIDRNTIDRSTASCDAFERLPASLRTVLFSHSLSRPIVFRGELPSLILIGMRAAGKTSLGKHAAACLGWPFFDVDHGARVFSRLADCFAVIEASIGCSIRVNCCMDLAQVCAGLRRQEVLAGISRA